MVMQRLGLAGEEEEQGQGVVLALIVSVLLLAALGLTLVWLNIERTKLAYNLQSMQRSMETRLELNAKLGVERDQLLSPRELGKKAADLGLRAALPGQIRRMPPLKEEQASANATARQ